MTTTEVLNSVQYMVDKDGKRTAAVVQINTWKSLLHLLNVADFNALPEVEDTKTPEQVIADAQSRPVRAENVIMPKGSLLEALQTPTYEDEDFNLNEWTKQWSAIEQEMKTITRQNDMAEGRA